MERIENNNIRNYRVAFEKIHSRLGFPSEVSLESGIKEIYSAIASDETLDFTADIFSNLAVVQAFATRAEAPRSSAAVSV